MIVTNLFDFLPNLSQRITISGIIDDEWFQTDYKPICAYEFDPIINLDDDSCAFNSIEVICYQIAVIENTQLELWTKLSDYMCYRRKLQSQG